MTQPAQVASDQWNAPSTTGVSLRSPAPRHGHVDPPGGLTKHLDFRGDVEGLRAVAVLAVLLWHGEVAALPGGFVGVDIFFVISGYLITRLIVTEIEKTGRLSLVGFYGRRAKRLLPGAAVVLSTTIALSYFFLPRIRWAETGWDIVSCGLYAINWRLAERSVDYLASDQAPSVVQHFWSLAVEEQFYLAWPALIMLTVFVIHRYRRSGGGLRGPLMFTTLAIAVPSLAWSIYLSSGSNGWAYFHTTTRVWELALGASVAIGARSLIRFPRTWAIAIGWAGFTAVVASLFILNRSMPFPGYVGLLPTVGAAAVIAAGPAAGRLGPVFALGTRPMLVVGALSYSLYLWHWPLLIISKAAFGESRSYQSLAVVCCSAVPAYLTYRFVENPFRFATRIRRSPGRAIRLGLICTAVPVVAGLVFQYTASQPRTARPSPAAIASVGLAASSDPSAPRLGAAVLGDLPRGDSKGAAIDKPGTFVPDPLSARDDLPDLYRDGCHASGTETEPRACTYGDPAGSFTVALVGDSHAAQWAPALQAIALARGWKIVIYTKSACPFLNSQVQSDGRAYVSCTSWNKAVLSRLLGAGRPNLVVTSNSLYLAMEEGRALGPAASLEVLGSGMRSIWSSLGAAGIRTVVLRDTPRPGIDIAECVSQYPQRMTKCAVNRDTALAGIGERQTTSAAGIPAVSLVNLNDAICPMDMCAAVIGGVLVYRDTNHLSATYAATLAPRLAHAIDRALAK